MGHIADITETFLTSEDLETLSRYERFPMFVYDETSLREQAKALTAMPHPYGFTGRFAMKACAIKAVLEIFKDEGLHIDASSGYEVHRAMRAGFAPEEIQITSQSIPVDLKDLIEKGVMYNACSLHQLDTYGQIVPGAEISIRVNPGQGSGFSAKTTTGGPLSSFGIWYEELPNVLELVKKHNLRLTGLHSHIGAGVDPDVWNHCAQLTLNIASELPDVKRISLGGGFKVARNAGEEHADLQQIGPSVRKSLEDFQASTGRELHLELEPGTFLTANCGAVVSNVIDIVSTGKDGHEFIKVNMGMTENMRIPLYDAVHPLIFVAKDKPLGEPRPQQVVGRCCETGDILTTDFRMLPKPHLDDYVILAGCGAYCDGFSVVGYNSYPQIGAALKTSSGEMKEIRKAQTLEQLLENEI